MTEASNNVIPLRIAETLANYPPFSMFAKEDVIQLARNCLVRAYLKEDCLWEQNDLPGDRLFFLCKGRVEYLHHTGTKEELVDVRDVGDLLGLTALLQNQSFLVTAKVTEDVLIYMIDFEAFRKIMETHDAARYYVRRHMFWASRVGARFSLPATNAQGEGLQLHSPMESAQVIRARPLSRLLTCSPDDNIEQAARLMTSKRVPSVVVVNAQRHPLGVLTSSDMVKYGIVERLPPATKVEAIMAKPAKTVAIGSSAMTAMLYMLRERIGQVCITEDGSPNSPILDVCTHKDLLTHSGHHPAGMVREIRSAKSTARLRELCDEMEHLAHGYLQSGLSAIFLGQFFAELHDELLQALLGIVHKEFRQNGQKIPKVNWAWIAIGSDGRREQILRTDMDNALIFRSAGSAQADQALREGFLPYTQRVIETLVECGFAPCQGGMMASNPRWCRSDTEWIQELEEGEYSDPQLLRWIALLDMRRVSGNVQLVEDVRDALFQHFKNSAQLQRKLAQLVMNTAPPLNFWGNIIVEKRGSESGRFDIKARGLNPIRDAARLLSLRYDIHSRYSTGGRLKALEKATDLHSDTLESAYQSYDFLFRLRTLTGLSHKNSGRYIEAQQLSKLQRASLINSFDVQRMLQRIIANEFHIDPNLR